MYNLRITAHSPCQASDTKNQLARSKNYLPRLSVIILQKNKTLIKYNNNYCNYTKHLFNCYFKSNTKNISIISYCLKVSNSFKYYICFITNFVIRVAAINDQNFNSPGQASTSKFNSPVEKWTRHRRAGEC